MSGATVSLLPGASISDIPLDGSKNTYSFGIIGLVPAATPTDIFAIGGSASKTIRVVRLVVSALQTTAGSIDAAIIKRSGGTQSAGTAGTWVFNDTNNTPAPTALLYTYTANPASLGTSLGVVAAAKLFVPSGATAAPPDKLILDYGIRPSQAQVLRGAAQFLCVNLNSITLTGGLVNIFCEITEE